MPCTLFISDLHLSDDTPAIEAGLYALLAREQDCDALYILGDFFEAWVGDDDDAPLTQRVRAALRQYADAGRRLYLMRGNRDFMLGEQFARDTGAELLGDSALIDLYGAPTLLMHGDTLCTDDTDYLNFRAMVHNADWQAEMMAKPLEERRELARQLRALSIDAASNKPEDIMDVNADAVDEAMERAGTTRLVHGHTHRPNRHVVPAGERIVLGDWGSTGWCLRASGQDLALEEFALS